MKKLLLLPFLIIGYSQGVYSQTLPRADDFIGLHFDFHARITDKAIGATITPQNVDSVLNYLKPDFIQVDTKGHTGFSSYPTKVGIQAPGLVKDPLILLRQETQKFGVGLYSHFSGIWDQEVLKKHPDWARIDINGQADSMATSIFSPYEKQYFVPQIEELIKKYHIDGIWVDGDDWAVQPDFSQNALNAYKDETGNQITNLQIIKYGTQRKDYIDFTRKSYDAYLKDWVSELHKYSPSFQIACNWAYSGYMPGPINSDINFLSGDLSDINPFEEAIYESRCLASYKTTWDLMTWIRQRGAAPYVKNDIQIEQEAAAILSQGGAFEMYVPQNRDASLPLNFLPLLKQVFDFCRERKEYCFKTEAVPQVALLLSVAGYENDINSNIVFNENKASGIKLQKTLDALLKKQYSVQILQEQQLLPNIQTFPYLVITDWPYLDNGFVNKVKSYVKNGGHLLVTGQSANYFSDIINSTSPGNISISSYGKGKIGVVSAQNNDLLTSILKDNIANLFDKPMVSVSGDDSIQVTITKKKSNLLLQLVNAIEPQVSTQEYTFYKNMPAAVPINISIALDQRPKFIKLQPEGRSLDFTYGNGRAEFKIPGVKVYSIVQIQQ